MWRENIFPTVTPPMRGRSGPRFEVVYLNSNLIIEMWQQEVKCFSNLSSVTLFDLKLQLFVFVVPFEIMILTGPVRFFCLQLD